MQTANLTMQEATLAEKLAMQRFSGFGPPYLQTSPTFAVSHTL